MKILKISHLVMILFAVGLFSCSESEEKKETTAEQKSERLASA